MKKIHKYPRTPHIEGSKEQFGDDMSLISFADISGKRLVVEEKMDGSQAGISFDESGNLFLQSRGHFLAGGPREKQFSLFKSFVSMDLEEFWRILGSRYVMYGEWLWAKHTIFYNKLPHYFMEFDIYDLAYDIWLSTAQRKEMLKGSKVVSVKVLADNKFNKLDDLSCMIKKSNFIEPSIMIDDLATACKKAKYEKGIEQTDQTGLMEGLYIKEEDDERVINRYKFVRKSFLDTVAESGGHWFDRPLVYNKLGE